MTSSDKPNFGKYQLLELLGAGATAEVYRALDRTLEREVALKLLKPSLVGDTQAFERFLQEARGAARLFHPNIATVLEVGESEGRYYIAMRYIPGRSLDKLLAEQGRLSWEETLCMAEQIGGALDFAHGEGFLHRDVKPSNILRTPAGEYVLTDFGLMKAMMATGLTTHTGALLGTPAYMAPEVWLGQSAGPATDQYALACVVYEALTGKVLFAGETPPAVMTRHVLKGAEMGGEWPQDAPQEVEAVLLKALAKEPTERYATAGEFVEALQEVGKAEAIEERKEARPEAQVLLETGKRLEAQGKLESALEIYRQALELALDDPALHSLRREIELTIQDLEIRVPLPSQPPTFDAKVGVSYQASQEPMSAAVIDLQQKNLNKWRLWFEWVLATTISVAIGYVLADYILRMIPIYLEGEPVIRAAYDVIVGTALGVAQWIILRSYFRSAGWWILGTSLGLCLNGFISGFVWDFLRIHGWMPGYWDVLSELVSRAPLGFLQWLFLRQYTRKSGDWIILTAVSWAIGWYLNGIWSYDKGWLMAGAVVGGTVGVITGSVLSMIAPFQLQGQK